MVYGYVRISTNKQDINNQKLALMDYADQYDLNIKKIYTEQISSRVIYKNRDICNIIKNLPEGSTLLTWELSRLGRSMWEISAIVQDLFSKNIKLIITNKNMELTDTIEGKTFIFALSIASEIERDLISQRTKNALEVARKKGKKLGRPKGSTSKSKLDPHLDQIEDLLSKKVSKASICKIYNVSYPTLQNFINTRL